MWHIMLYLIVNLCFELKLQVLSPSINVNVIHIQTFLKYTKRDFDVHANYFGVIFKKISLQGFESCILLITKCTKKSFLKTFLLYIVTY